MHLRRVFLAAAVLHASAAVSRAAAPCTWQVVVGSATTDAGDNGPATQAQLNNPRGLTRDSQGNLYVADYGNNKVRKISNSGIITTIAGTGVRGGAGDNGPATAA